MRQAAKIVGDYNNSRSMAHAGASQFGDRTRRLRCGRQVSKSRSAAKGDTVSENVPPAQHLHRRRKICIYAGEAIPKEPPNMAVIVQ